MEAREEAATGFTPDFSSTTSAAKKSAPKLIEEYVVKLHVNSKNAVDAQSEVHYLSDKHFLILSRDSGSGGGSQQLNICLSPG